MKECTECEYFDGYNRDDGTPICEYDGGYEECPYAEEGTTDQIESKVIVTIDKDDLNTRIISAFQNSISNHVRSAVSNIVEAEYGKRIREITTETMQNKISEHVETFLQQPIEIGGGWREKSRTLTRDEFLSETIQKNLDGKFDEEKLSKSIAESIKNSIDKFSLGVKTDINFKVKNMFDDAMKQNLTDSIVSMLMDNDTYKRLSGSMKSLIGNSK